MTWKFDTLSPYDKAIKKPHKNQRAQLDAALRTIAANPSIGESKTGDLAGVRVYKFKIHKQTHLLAYSVSEQTQSITLIDLGSHQNFYRDLKRLPS